MTGKRPAGRAVAREAASLLLTAAVGALAGACSWGLATFYVYFLGAWPGALVGAWLGGWLGLRTPLRDSVTLFVSCFGGLAAGGALADRMRAAVAAGAGAEPVGVASFARDLGLPAAGALVGVVLVFLPVRRFVPFAARRSVAAVFALLAAAYLLGRLYRYAYAG